MKNLRFPSLSFARCAALATLFTLFGWSLTAQTIGGTVLEECTGKPIGGATIRISVNIPGSPLGNWSFPTDPDGTWDFSFFSGDPNGPYTITVGGGASSPGTYIYYRSQGNNMGLNFDLLPLSFEVNINGEDIFWQNNPSAPHTVCKNVQNCIDLVPILDGVKIANGLYCYQVSLYATNSGGAQGTLLAESNCTSFGRLAIDNPCDHGSFDLNALLEDIEGKLPPVIRMEVQQFCCESGCVPGEGVLVNTEVVYIEVLDIGLADADFKLVDGTVPSGVSDRS
jgi:hypothetical protein